MSNQSLADTANHVVAQYSAAGKTLNQAYRATVERVLGDAKTRFASVLEARSSRGHKAARRRALSPLTG